jgi:hypothetical protein
MATKKKPIKDKVKAKAKAVKEKLKGKCNGACKCGVILFALCLVGCQTPEQASRSTRAEYGDIEPDVRVEVNGTNTVSVAVHITIGDGALASADSAGSTESQTQTPTFDIKPDLDVHYNDAVGKGGDFATSLMGALTPAAKALLQKAIAEKQTGTLTLEKTDGGTVQVQCENGVCSPCEGGACSPPASAR